MAETRPLRVFDRESGKTVTITPGPNGELPTAEELHSLAQGTPDVQLEFPGMPMPQGSNEPSNTTASEFGKNVAQYAIPAAVGAGAAALMPTGIPAIVGPPLIDAATEYLMQKSGINEPSSLGVVAAGAGGPAGMMVGKMGGKAMRWMGNATHWQDYSEQIMKFTDQFKPQGKSKALYKQIEANTAGEMITPRAVETLKNELPNLTKSLSSELGLLDDMVRQDIRTEKTTSTVRQVVKGQEVKETVGLKSARSQKNADGSMAQGTVGGEGTSMRIDPTLPEDGPVRRMMASATMTDAPTKGPVQPVSFSEAWATLRRVNELRRKADIGTEKRFYLDKISQAIMEDLDASATSPLLRQANAIRLQESVGERLGEFMRDNSSIIQGKNLKEMFVSPTGMLKSWRAMLDEDPSYYEKGLGVQNVAEITKMLEEMAKFDPIKGTIGEASGRGAAGGFLGAQTGAGMGMGAGAGAALGAATALKIGNIFSQVVLNPVARPILLYAFRQNAGRLTVPMLAGIGAMVGSHILGQGFGARRQPQDPRQGIQLQGAP